MYEKKKGIIVALLSILLIVSVCMNVYLIHQLNGIKQQLPQIQNQLSIAESNLDTANQELANMK